jgi:hypothetical protein
MTLPIITMNSVSIHASTHQRLGPDYLDGSNRGNWNIGEAAVFVWGVGLLPFKDTFLSNSKQTPPTHANTGTGSGGFKGFVETAPELHALSALLSAGPVSPSDGIDGANIPLLKSLCRSDGMLLKPEKPARAIDAQWIGQVFNVSSPGGSPSGVLWTTATTLPGSDRTWSYVLSVSSEKDWCVGSTYLPTCDLASFYRLQSLATLRSQIICHHSGHAGVLLCVCLFLQECQRRDAEPTRRHQRDARLHLDTPARNVRLGAGDSQ